MIVFIHYFDYFCNVTSFHTVKMAGGGGETTETRKNNHNETQKQVA